MNYKLNTKNKAQNTNKQKLKTYNQSKTLLSVQTLVEKDNQKK